MPFIDADALASLSKLYEGVASVEHFKTWREGIASAPDAGIRFFLSNTAVGEIF